MAVPLGGLARRVDNLPEAFPPVCYDVYNSAYREAQIVGKVPALCDSDSNFKSYWSGCNVCIEGNASDPSMAPTRAYFNAIIGPFVDYCMVAEPVLLFPAISTETTVSTATPSAFTPTAPVVTTSQAPANTDKPNDSTTVVNWQPGGGGTKAEVTTIVNGQPGGGGIKAEVNADTAATLGPGPAQIHSISGATLVVSSAASHGGSGGGTQSKLLVGTPASPSTTPPTATTTGDTPSTKLDTTSTTTSMPGLSTFTTGVIPPGTSTNTIITTSTSTPPPNNAPSPPSIPLIVGITAGAVAGVAVVLVMVFYCVWRRKTAITKQLTDALIYERAQLHGESRAIAHRTPSPSLMQEFEGSSMRWGELGARTPVAELEIPRQEIELPVEAKEIC